VDQFVTRLRGLGAEVATGRFGAAMEVELVNDGPFTLVIDSGQDLPS
jgi:D-aminoacyl-tRNA deacylase